MILATGVRKGTAKGKAEAEALIRQMNRRFNLSASDLQKIRAVRDLNKLQAALDEIIEPNATRESVLRQLEVLPYTNDAALHYNDI